MQFRLLPDPRLELGESPVWDDRRGVVFLCDIMGGRVLALSLDGGQMRDWQVGERACSLGLCESGRLMVALAREIILFDPDRGARETVARLAGELDTNRFNDGKVGPDGAFWVGTVDQRSERQPVAALYRLDASGVLARRRSGLHNSNGLGWSPDGRQMFHSDSNGPWIERSDFDPATGASGAPIRIADLTEADGRPDGAAVDAEGCYWSAGVSAGCLNRFSPDGVLVAKYALPVAAPTMPCFCGPDLKTLLVTSHRILPPAQRAENPVNGAVLIAESGVAGTPVARVKGC